MLEGGLLKEAHARLGTVIQGTYRLDRLIGAGGMAAVYAATHRAGNRVAVKILHSDVARNAAIRERFQREAYAANRVAHPGVARVFDHGIDAAGCAYIGLELLEGQTLEARWDAARKHLPSVEVVAHADRVLDVLDAAHACGVVHRDIKPENVFLTSDGGLKVLDFGIARLLELASMTRSGELMGTPAFMSPEQAAGNSRDADPRADVWSVGAMMFTLLSGQFVHEGTTSAMMMIRAATTPAPSLGSVVPGVDRKLAAVVDIALAYEVKDRWASARAMQHALRETGIVPPLQAAAPFAQTELAPGGQDTLPFALVPKLK